MSKCQNMQNVKKVKIFGKSSKSHDVQSRVNFISYFRAVQKILFRVAFHGGIGNVWKALMTIPEVLLLFTLCFLKCLHLKKPILYYLLQARQVKRCMNIQDECMVMEVLRVEVQTLGEAGQDVPEYQRLLINPEFVESMDISDGSEKFSPEDQKIEDQAMDEAV
jgi:hypothetical protein